MGKRGGGMKRGGHQQPSLPSSSSSSFPDDVKAAGLRFCLFPLSHKRAERTDPLQAKPSRAEPRRASAPPERTPRLHHYNHHHPPPPLLLPHPSPSPSPTAVQWLWSRKQPSVSFSVRTSGGSEETAETRRLWRSSAGRLESKNCTQQQNPLQHLSGLLFGRFFPSSELFPAQFVSRDSLYFFSSSSALSLRGEDAGEGGELLHGMLETNAAVVRPGSALDPAAGPR